MDELNVERCSTMFSCQFLCVKGRFYVVTVHTLIFVASFFLVLQCVLRTLSPQCLILESMPFSLEEAFADHIGSAAARGNVVVSVFYRFARVCSYHGSSSMEEDPGLG